MYAFKFSSLASCLPLILQAKVQSLYLNFYLNYKQYYFMYCLKIIIIFALVWQNAQTLYLQKVQGTYFLHTVKFSQTYALSLSIKMKEQVQRWYVACLGHKHINLYGYREWLSAWPDRSCIQSALIALGF